MTHGMLAFAQLYQNSPLIFLHSPLKSFSQNLSANRNNIHKDYLSIQKQPTDDADHRPTIPKNKHRQYNHRDHNIHTREARLTPEVTF